MAKAVPDNFTNHTDHPYDNGAVGAIASVASAGAALGTAIGMAAGLHGLLVGAAIGGTIGVLAAAAVAEEMEHPNSFITLKKTVF